MPLSLDARLHRAGPNPVGNAERREIGSDGAIDTAGTVPQAKPGTGVGSVCDPDPDCGHCHRGVRRTLYVMRQRWSGRLVGWVGEPDRYLLGRARR